MSKVTSSRLKTLGNNEANKLRSSGYWVPMPGPQTLASAVASDRRFREILYGGARGGGKTDLSIALLGVRLANKRAKQLVIRRNADDLTDFEWRAKEAYQFLGIKTTHKPLLFTGKGRGRLLGGHLNDEDSYTKYQGHEYCRINIEELTQIPYEDMYLRLISSARSKYGDLYPQVFSTTNPGGVGMAWVKERFVTPDTDLCDVVHNTYKWYDYESKEHETHWQVVIDKHTGLWRAYIPATIDSNPILMKADPEYVRQLEGLKQTNPELYEAWRNGSWDVQFGAVFDDFSTERHVFDKFAEFGITQKQYKSSWKICGMDWGYNDECVLLWAMFDQIGDGKERAFIFREKHGNHHGSEWWAKEFARIQEKDPVDVFAMPHDAYAHSGGADKTIAEAFKEQTDLLPPDIRPVYVRADKMMRDKKISAIDTLHNMFANALDNEPSLLFHRTCSYLIKTLPTIVYAKETGGEELDKNNVDHALDALFYTLLTADRVRGSLVNRSQLIKKVTPSFVVGLHNVYKDVGLDIERLVKEANQPKRDWRTI